MPVVGEYGPIDEKWSDLKGPEGDILGEFFIEDGIEFLKFNFVFPIPLSLHELAILHIASQWNFLQGSKFNHPSIVGC